MAFRLRLVFEDAASQEDGGPSHEDIERLIEFARRVDLTKGQLLVHCWSGISRSSAAAIITLAVLGGPGQEAAAATRVFAAKADVRPNLRMIELADTILASGGALVRACLQRGAS